MNQNSFALFEVLEKSPDLVNTLVMVGIGLLISVTYFIRVVFLGRAQFDRVDREGQSAIINKSFMEMAYWSLQPWARLLIYLGISPNMISWSSFVLAILAGTCLAFGHFGFGAGFAAIAALLDTLDGMVARMKGMASDAGEVLDAAVDRYTEFFFLAGLIVYYREMPVLIILCLLALMGSFMVSYSTAKAEAMKVTPPRGSMRRTERATLLTLGALLSPISIPWLEISSKAPVAIGYPMVIAVGVSVSKSV